MHFTNRRAGLARSAEPHALQILFPLPPANCPRLIHFLNMKFRQHLRNVGLTASLALESANGNSIGRQPYHSGREAIARVAISPLTYRDSIVKVRLASARSTMPCICLTHGKT